MFYEPVTRQDLSPVSTKQDGAELEFLGVGIEATLERSMLAPDLDLGVSNALVLVRENVACS